MKMFVLPASLVAALAFSVAGCGSDSEEKSEESSTPAQAVSELHETESVLDRALVSYRAGKAKEAENAVGDAYLEHFEHVEGPLGDRDHELMEELEERISTEIREKMKDGATVAEVESLVAETKREIGRAVETLQK